MIGPGTTLRDNTLRTRGLAIQLVGVTPKLAP